MIHLASYDSYSGTNGVPWLKSHVSPYFDHWPNECNGTIDNTIGTTKMCLDIVLSCLEIVWTCVDT